MDIYLKLQESSGGQIDVIAVDKDGQKLETGYLITFRNDGTIYRQGGVNGEFGFQLDEQGKIKES